jgi:hypothetical protein
LFYLHIILSSTVLLSLVSTLPHCYSFLEKKKLMQIFLFQLNKANYLPYHVPIDLLALSSLYQNKHYNFTYSLWIELSSISWISQSGEFFGINMFCFILFYEKIIHNILFLKSTMCCHTLILVYLTLMVKMEKLYS